MIVRLSSNLLKRCQFQVYRNRWLSSQEISKTEIPVTSKGNTYFVTTPIYYVNAAPHIGHLYSCVIADAAARYRQLKGDEILFSTGTDEHGLKIQQAAELNNTTPLKFSDRVSQSFKDMFDSYGISYTDFIRTTEERHRKIVEQIWGELETRGYIYKGLYEGWYSVADEAFLGDEEVTDAINKHGQTIKVSSTSGHPVTWMKEENYMFKLSEFQQPLHTWLDQKVIHPEKFEADVRHHVDQLRDLSVSRARDRLSWGIPVPGDNSQTIYVWLDALINYLTVSGYPDPKHVWPPDCQVVGKDIIKFHAVYWPAFLMALGLQPPKKIFCHSHWMVDGMKMSKSRGNVVDPMVVREKYSSEVFRYFLLREGVPYNDGNYNEQVGMEYVNSDLVNNMGNLLSRCTAQSLNPDQIYPRRNEDSYHRDFNAAERETFENLELLRDAVEKHYEDLHFSRAIESIMSYLRWANNLIQTHEPWKLAKSQDEKAIAHLKTCIHLALETLRVSGILLQPVIPEMSTRLLNRLGIPPEKRTFESASLPYLNSPKHYPLGPNEGVLMKRLVIPKSDKPR